MSAVSLNGLLHGNATRIVIPKIQRDYAEGRETESVIKKRTKLLGDLLDVVYGVKGNLSLDFVYGIKETDGSFLPLDGQQRLTTLFLLYWLFGRNDDIKDVEDHSLFVYKTRKTSEDFLHWIVGQSSQPIIMAWEKEVECAKTTNANNIQKWNSVQNNKGKVDKIANRLAFPLVKVPSLFDYFMEMDDFKWEWHIDPNIHSMIVVLETACDTIDSMNQDLQTGVCNNNKLDNITFELLPNLDCDGDELFEKMNARGKELSPFDLLKSMLEEELETQKAAVSNDWRNAIDNAWIDYCWSNSSIPVNPMLEDVKKVELKLERMLVRMIGKSFFKNDIDITPPTKPSEVILGQVLKDCILKDCDVVVDNYFKYAKYERGCGNKNMTELDLRMVFQDINCMLYTEKDAKGKDVWRDISWYLHHNGLKMHPDNENTLLDDFLTDNLKHDTRVIFYGMIAYLRVVGAMSIVGDSKTGNCFNSDEFDNFKDWMRFLRNVFSAANKNVRIDNPERVVNAIEAIDDWLKEYFSNYHKSHGNDEMLRCISEYIVNNSNKQEQARLDEEAIKAELRLGKAISVSGTRSQWETAIYEAEENPYLWGQIVAPLEWAKNASNAYDFQEFVKYTKKLHELFSVPSNVTDIKLLQACVSIRSYRLNGNATWGSLGILKDDRDISWKRHLREYDGVTYGALLNSLVNQWMTSKYDALSYAVFLSQFKLDNLSSIPNTDWRFFVCNLSERSLETAFKYVGTYYRYINEDAGKVYLYRSKTLRSDAIRFELVTMYLYLKLQPNARIEHVNGVGGAYVEFSIGVDIYRVSSIIGGLYDISKNGTTYVSGADIPTLESELIKLGVITSL